MQRQNRLLHFSLSLYLHVEAIRDALARGGPVSEKRVQDVSLGVTTFDPAQAYGPVVSYTKMIDWGQFPEVLHIKNSSPHPCKLGELLPASAEKARVAAEEAASPCCWNAVSMCVVSRRERVGFCAEGRVFVRRQAITLVSISGHTQVCTGHN